MKKYTPVFMIFVFVVIIVGVFLSLGKVQNMVVIKKGNLEKIPLDIEVGKYQDSFCGMVINDLGYVSEVIAPDGKTW